MSELRQVGSLEIDEDLDFQRGEWRVQNVLWIVSAILLVLALIGFFGGGPISSTTNASDDGAVSVNYHRFVRHDGRAALNFRVDATGASSQEVEIWIDQEFLDNVEVETVSPAVRRTAASSKAPPIRIANDHSSSTPTHSKRRAKLVVSSAAVGRITAQASQGSGDSR